MSCLCGVHYKTANNLVLNLEKMNIKKFVRKNSSHSTVHIGYKEKYILETVNTEFLGLQIDNHINCKNHIEEMIHNLSASYYAIRLMVHISDINTMKSIYCAYFHSIVKYGIIFGGNSSNSGNIFTFQKKLSELWLVHNPELHCRSLFKQPEILPVPCQYIFSLMNFIISN